MSGKEWKFNPITGTVEPVNAVAHGLEKKVSASDDVQRVNGPATIPVIKGGKSIINDVHTIKPNVTVNEREIRFREKSDLSVVQITDYDTNRVMGYIAGYGLDINFNMEELNSMDRDKTSLNKLL